MTTIEEMNNNYVLETVGRIFEEVHMIRILLDKEGKFAVETPKSRDARSKQTPKEPSKISIEKPNQPTGQQAVDKASPKLGSGREREPETPLQLKAPTPNKAIADLRTMFPDNLEALVEFFDRGSYVEVKPITYLGSDNYRKIASIIKEAGGDYVSAGRNSHFRVPKTERQKQ